MRRVILRRNSTLPCHETRQKVYMMYWSAMPMYCPVSGSEMEPVSGSTMPPVAGSVSTSCRV